MKKAKLLSLLLCVVPMTACGAQGVETINNEEALQKELPELVKTTADAYEDNECATLTVDIKSFNLDVTRAGFTAKVPVSGQVVLGAKNIYTTEGAKLEAGIVFKNFSFGVDYQQAEGEKKSYQVKDFSMGAYLNNKNLYVDISSTSLMDGLVSIVSDLLGGNQLISATLKTALGEGKFVINNVLKDEQFPIVKKEDVTLENISTIINNYAELIEDEDLQKIMSLTHNKGDNTYALKLTLNDPALINKEMNEQSSQPLPVKGQCDAVNLTLEVTTDGKGVFNGVKVAGDISYKGDDAENPVTSKLSLDVEAKLDFSKYGIETPSFTGYKNPEALMQFISGIIGGLVPNQGTDAEQFLDQ